MSNTAELQAYLNRPLPDLLEELSLYAPAERFAQIRRHRRGVATEGSSGRTVSRPLAPNP